jgi:predicted outer membrane protein
MKMTMLKPVHKKAGIYLAIAALSFATSCQSSDREHRDTAAQPVDSSVDATMKAQVATADVNMDGAEKAFILETYSKSLYTSELARLSSKSSNRSVRSLGKTIATNHEKLLTAIEKIAKGKGLVLNRVLSPTHKQELAPLKELSSPTLDEQFLQKMQLLQAGSTVVYDKAQHLQNSDLKQYAQNAMSVIHNEQAATTKLFEALNGTASQGTRPGEVATPLQKAP